MSRSEFGIGENRGFIALAELVAACRRYEQWLGESLVATDQLLLALTHGDATSALEAARALVETIEKAATRHCALGDRPDELLRHAAMRGYSRFHQFDAFRWEPNGNRATPDKDGDCLLATDTFDHMTGSFDLRVMFTVGTSKETAVRQLAKIIHYIERDGFFEEPEPVPVREPDQADESKRRQAEQAERRDYLDVLRECGIDIVAWNAFHRLCCETGAGATQSVALGECPICGQRMVVEVRVDTWTPSGAQGRVTFDCCGSHSYAAEVEWTGSRCSGGLACDEPDDKPDDADFPF